MRYCKRPHSEMQDLKIIRFGLAHLKFSLISLDSLASYAVKYPNILSFAK